MSPDTLSIVRHLRARRRWEAMQRTRRGRPRLCHQCKHKFWTSQRDDKPLCPRCWRRAPMEVIQL